MIFRLLSLLFFFYWTTLQAQSSSEFPMYEEVTEVFIRRTKVCRVDFSLFKKVILEKRADGYWASLATLTAIDSGFTISQSQLFWSKASKEYLKVRFDDQAKAHHAITLDDILLSHATEQYNRFPFYGYRDWVDDVIAYYKEKESRKALTNEECYALSGAYSCYANYLVSFPIEYVHPSRHYIARAPNEKVTGEQYNKLCFALDAKLDYLYQVYKKDAAFKTNLNSIYTEYCNQLVAKYLLLARHAPKNEALSYLTKLKAKKLYSNETKSLVRNLLVSCLDSAILFNYDATTIYCAAYLQEYENLRKDILLVDIHLLGSHHYLNHLQDSSHYHNPLKLGVDPDFYHNLNNELVYLKEQPRNPLHADDFIAAIDSQHYKNSSPLIRISTLNTNRFLLKTQGEKFMLVDCPNQHLSKSQYMLMLLINANAGKRPLCFGYAYVYDEDGYISALGLSPYIRQRGLIYYLSNKRSQEEYPSVYLVDGDSSYNILTQKLDWITFKQKIALENEHLFYFFSTNCIWVALDLKSNNRYKEAVEIIDDFLETFPLQIQRFDAYFGYYAIDVYLDCKERNKAKKICKFYFNKLLKEEILTDRDFVFVDKIHVILELANIHIFDKQIEALIAMPRELPVLIDDE